MIHTFIQMINYITLKKNQKNMLFNDVKKKSFLKEKKNAF
jgi:hypothetical protein